MKPMNRNSALAAAPAHSFAIDFVARGCAIAALVETEAATTETGGTLSPHVVEAMRESELFWMLVPAELGGGAQSLTSAIEVIEEISCADGSSGWTLMANCT